MAEGAASTYDPCKSLSYILVTPQGGSVSTPYHIALFHKGTYLGTATQEPQGYYPKVSRLMDNSISVQYRYPKGMECNACASGKTTATFTYSELANKVIMVGSIPPKVGQPS